MPNNSASRPLPWSPAAVATEPIPGPTITHTGLLLIWNRLDEGARRILMTVAIALDPLSTESEAKAVAKTLTAKDRALFGFAEAAVIAGAP